MDQGAADRPVPIGQLAAAVGLNPRTIRYYEQIGLLPKPARTAAGYRLYRHADQERLQFILKAKAIGLRLDEIQEILTVRGAGQPPCRQVLAMLDRKLAVVDQQLRALAAFREELASLREAATGALADETGICAIIEHHQRSEQGGNVSPRGAAGLSVGRQG